MEENKIIDKVRQLKASSETDRAKVPARNPARSQNTT